MYSSAALAIILSISLPSCSLNSGHITKEVINTITDNTATATKATEIPKDSAHPLKEGSNTNQEPFDSPSSLANSWAQRIEKADNIIIATNKNPADALTTGALQGTLDAPIFFADPETGLNEETIANLKRLEAKHAIIIGGMKAVPDQVLLQYSFQSAERLLGQTRIETSTAVANRIIRETNDPSKVLIIRSKGGMDQTQGFADAISAGAYAAANKIPVLLTSPYRLHQNTKNWISTNAPHADITLIGGKKALTERLEHEISLLGSPVDRISGTTRLETSLAIAEKTPNPKGIIAVNGHSSLGWADGISASLVSAKEQLPVIVLNNNRDVAQKEYQQVLKTFPSINIATSLGFGGSTKSIDNDFANWEENLKAPEPQKTDTVISVAAMGDMLPHGGIVAGARVQDGYDFGKYFEPVKHTYADADLVFCNQEALSAGPSYGITGYPAFNAPFEFAHGLSAGGCNIVNLANNHMGDRNTKAIGLTLDQWDQSHAYIATGASRTKEEQDKIQIVEVDGIKVALLGFTALSNQSFDKHTLNHTRDKELLNRLTKEARNKADIVMVSMHWGTEDSHTVNAEQRDLSQLLANNGVDVIIGTGPHVLQETTWLPKAGGGRTLLWNSIGNFLTAQRKKDQRNTIVAHFDIVAKTDGTFEVQNPSATPILMTYNPGRTNFRMVPTKDAAHDINTDFGSGTPESFIDEVRRYLGPEVTIR